MAKGTRRILMVAPMRANSSMESMMDRECIATLMVKYIKDNFRMD